jgi:uncharacterized phage protein gp47/JayE
MFESQTFEVILQRMLDNVSDEVDKREGSVIYDALAPCAIELVSAYIAFDSMLEETFGDTASREYLIRLCAERGIEPYEATNSICTVSLVGAEVPVGNRFTGGDTTYVYLGNNQVQCEEAGTIGNEHTGTIIPIEYVQGLESAEITEIAVYGEDEEDTEALRERYFESFEAKAYGGNRKDYEEKALAQDGVGDVKITPVWNGAGTVKVTVLNSVFGTASDTLIENLQEIFDPNSDGKGNGIAPIGHVVTVDTAVEVEINVSTTISYDSGYSWNECGTLITEAIENYLLSLRKEWSSNTNLVVRIAQIDSAILNVQGVIDVSGTTINSSDSNITLSEYEVPVLGVVNSD